MDNIVIVDDDSDNNEEVVTATAQILDGLPINTSDNQAMTEQNINTNQIKIIIMDSGDVQIENPDGKAYLVGKEILEQENIDTNYLTDESIQLLLNMTLSSEYYSHVPILDHPNQQQQQGHQNVKTSLGSSNGGFAHSNQAQQGHQDVKTSLGLGSSNGSTSLTDQPNRRKRQNKEIFDPSPSATVKAKRNRIITNTKNSAIVGNGGNLKFVPYRTDHTTNANAFSASAPVNSSIRPPVLAKHVIDLAKICKLPGVVIYNPDHDHQPSSNSLPLHCVYCHNPIPKSKMDFILIRLPVHIECSGNDGDANMPVLPNSNEVNNDKEK